MRELLYRVDNSCDDLMIFDGVRLM